VSYAKKGTWKLSILPFSEQRMSLSRWNEFIVDSNVLDHGLLGSWNSRSSSIFP